MEAAENLAGGRGILCSLVRVGGNRAGVVWDHLPLTTRARGPHGWQLGKHSCACKREGWGGQDKQSFVPQPATERSLPPALMPWPGSRL